MVPYRVMHPAMKFTPSVEAVIATGDLAHRSLRPVNSTEETEALLDLTRALAHSPKDFFQQLAKSALKLSGAGSTGISLLNESTKRFVWPAVAGELKSYLGSGTPRDFGPCGTVLERGDSQLFIRPQRHFTYLDSVTPVLEEVLLIPFQSHGKPVGTIWAVSHDPARRFCLEDKRLLESLSVFAASAYSALSNSGALQPILEMQPQAC